MASTNRTAQRLSLPARFRRAEAGAIAVEYAVLLSMVALIVAAIALTGEHVGDLYAEIASHFD